MEILILISAATACGSEVGRRFNYVSSSSSWT